MKQESRHPLSTSMSIKIGYFQDGYSENGTVPIRHHSIIVDESIINVESNLNH